MRKIKFFAMLFAVAAMFTACDPEKPPVIPGGGDDPLEEAPVLANPGAGKVTVAVRVPDGTCNGLIAVGAKLDSAGADDWDPAAKKHPFIKVEGKNTWYQITLPYDASMSVKVIALTDEGVADWGTQWGMNVEGAPENVTKLDGTVTFDNSENGGEVAAKAFADNSVVYIDIKAWKSAPCVERNKAGEATFELTAPANTPAGAVVGIVGNFPDKSWMPDSAVVMTLANGKWTATANVSDRQEYKYILKLADSTWGYKNEENGSNRHMPINLKAVDVVTEWKGLPAATE